MLSIDFTASVLNLFWIPPLVYSGAMILHHPKDAKDWSKWTTESDKLKLHSMLHSSICLSYALRLPTTKFSMYPSRHQIHIESCNHFTCTAKTLIQW